MASIIVVSGKQRGRCIQLDDAPVTIGRDASCALALEDDRVSRNHVEVGYDEESQVYFARDLGSTNGVSIGERRIDETQLLDRDVLTVGDTRIMFAMRDFPDRRSALAFCDEPAREAGPTVARQRPADDDWANA